MEIGPHELVPISLHTSSQVTTKATLSSPRRNEQRLVDFRSRISIALLFEMPETSPVVHPDGSPYAGELLSPDAKTDLSVLVHFLLLFSEALGLYPHDLLQTHAESSLLLQTGRPFDALSSFLAAASKTPLKTFLGHVSTLSCPEAKLGHLRTLTDSYAHHTDLRKFITSEEGRVLPAARLRVGARDSAGVAYTWLRGPDGCCSDRIVATVGTKSCCVLRTNEVLHVITRLESGNRRRHDLLAAGWLRERIDRSATRSSRVERAEEESIRRQERARNKSGLIGGLHVDTVGCGRGRRERKKVCYEEEDGDDELSEENDGDDEEDDFIVDSGGEQDSDESQDESEILGEDDVDMAGWDAHPSAAGRRRVVSDTRHTRSRAAIEEEGRNVRKSGRLLRSSCL